MRSISSRWSETICAALALVLLTACGPGGQGSGPSSTSAAVTTGSTSTAVANVAPVPIDDTATATGSTQDVDVLTNDSDPDGDALSIMAVASPTNGSAIIWDAGTPGNKADDMVRYTPTPGYAGPDEFTYTLGDAGGASAIGKVTIYTADLAQDLRATTLLNTPVNIALSVPGNETVVAVTPPSFGSVSIDRRGTPDDPSDDQIVYAPASGYTGADAFTYTVSGASGQDTAGVTIFVTDNTTTTIGANLSGQVLKGPVREALVRIYEMGLDGQRVGVPVALATTDALGRWSTTVPTPRTGLLVVASGGRYDDETRTTGNARTIQLAPEDELIAVALADDDRVVSSIYTYAHYLRARRAGGATAFAAAYADVRANATLAWDLDLATSDAANPSAPDSGAPAAARRHALALGGAANALERIVAGLGRAQPDGATMRALARDLSDCVLDGRDADGVIEVDVAGIPRAIAANLNLNLEILRFRNNRAAQFGTTPLPQWRAPDCVAPALPADAQPPQVSVDFQRTSDRTPPLSGAIDDPLARVVVIVDGVRYNAVNLGNTWRLPAGRIAPPLGDGVHDVRVEATDYNGNVGADVTPSDLVVDATAPVLVLAPAAVANPSPGIGGAIDDPTATVIVTIAGSDYPADVTGSTWTLPAGRIAPALADGSYAVTVTATDSFGNTAITNLSAGVTVSANTPPTFQLSANIDVNEGFVGARQVIVTPDPVPVSEAGQSVVYRLQPATSAIADVTISPVTGRVTIVALPGVSGSESFSVVADDGQALANTASRSFTLTVNPVNNPPDFTLSGDVIEIQDFSGTRTVTAMPEPVPADEATQTVSYRLEPPSVAFADLSIDPASGTVSVRSVPGGVGSQLLSVIADDGQSANATATRSFVLAIGAAPSINQPPVIDGQNLISLGEDSARTLTLADVTVIDPDNAFPADFTLAVLPGSDYSVSGTTITPSADFAGTLSVPVTVFDGQDSSAVRTLIVSVNAVNDAPVFALSGDLSEDEDFAGTRSIFVNPGAVPADEVVQTVTYSLSPASVAFANVSLDSATGRIDVTAVPDGAGSQVFTVIADDGSSVNSQASATFTLTVNAINDAPRATPIPNIDAYDNLAIDTLNLFDAFDDAEEPDTALTLTVTGNTDPNLFDAIGIDPATGELTLDYATGVRGNSTVTIRATDSDGDYTDTSIEVALVPRADLSISTLTVSDSSPAYGSDVEFTLTVQNSGPSQAADVQIDVPLPAGYVFQSASAPAEYNAVTGIWTRAQIASSATLVITARVQSVGPYLLVAEVVDQLGEDPDSTPADGDPAQDDYASISASPQPLTDVTLSAVVSDPIPAPADSLTLTVTLENAGPADATGMSVSLPPLPGQYTYEGFVASDGSFDVATGLWSGVNVAWSGDPAAPLGATLTVTVRIDAGVALSSVVTVPTELTAIDQSESDGGERDEAVMLVLGNGLVHTWVGGTAPDPADWHDPNNWSSLTVPTPGDEAIIPATANDPVLNANSLSLALLDIATGAQVTANGFTISIRGALDAADGPVVGPGLVRLEWGTLRGTVPDLTIEGVTDSAEVDFDADVTVNGTLTVQKGILDVRDKTVTINGDLVSTGTGLLKQKIAGSEIYVNGDALFEGGDYTQLVDNAWPLRKGDIYIRGNFTQTGDPHSFAAERSHRVIFDGTGPQTIYMQNPDNSNVSEASPAATGSRFSRLRIDKDAAVDGPVTLLSDVAVLRRLLHNGNGTARIAAAPGSGHRLIVGGTNLDAAPFPLTHNLVFDNVPLHIVEGLSLNDFNGLVFRNMDPAVVQLSVARDESTPTMQFYGLRFETLPDYAAGGRYIELRNTDAAPDDGVWLEVYQSMPAYGEPMSSVVGFAGISWGWSGYDSDGDGLRDTDEYAAGTNPVFVDSDFDGLTDPAELAGSTDPSVQDTDADGIGDATELLAGSDPVTPAAPGSVIYVRPAPLGDDANAGTGGWGDALATNDAVAAALVDGAAPDQPTYVLYAAGTYGALEIRDHVNVSLVGSLGPSKPVPDVVPSTVFDATVTPDVAVVEVVNSTNVDLLSLNLRGASNFGSGQGGGLYVDAASEAVGNHLLIEDNVAQHAGGGGFVASGGSLTLNDSLVRRNVAQGTGGGGGVAAYGALAVARTTLADNRYTGADANGGGGALYASPVFGNVTLQDNRILGNFSATNGGGLWLYDVFGSTAVYNNLIVGNVADLGVGGGLGGDRLANGPLTLIASNTLSMNSLLTRSDAAGGIALAVAGDVQVRDNIAWYNNDADAVDELADQFLDDASTASVIYNALEDFPGSDAFGNHGSDPKFEYGFYLRSDSPSVNRGSMDSATAGLSAPYMTNAAGYTDAGTLNQGYHFVRRAEGVPYEAYLVGESVSCATNSYTMRVVIAAVGGDHGPGHAVAVRLDGGDSGGGSVVTLAPYEPFGWGNSRLAIDEGDGVYRLTVDGVAWGAGQVTLIELRVDDDQTMKVPSTDLTTLFTDAGC